MPDELLPETDSGLIAAPIHQSRFLHFIGFIAACPARL
jgi:hypothetical protein